MWRHCVLRQLLAAAAQVHLQTSNAAAGGCGTAAASTCSMAATAAATCLAFYGTPWHQIAHASSEGQGRVVAQSTSVVRALSVAIKLSRLPANRNGFLPSYGCELPVCRGISSWWRPKPRNPMVFAPPAQNNPNLGGFGQALAMSSNVEAYVTSGRHCVTPFACCITTMLCLWRIEHATGDSTCNM